MSKFTPPSPAPALHCCAQVQGVLAAAGESWPHIHISDSLVMADAAVKMAQAGCTSIAVLGVDFMSENVRAILDEAGLQDVKVWLGCWDLPVGCCGGAYMCAVCPREQHIHQPCFKQVMLGLVQQLSVCLCVCAPCCVCRVSGSMTCALAACVLHVCCVAPGVSHVI